MRPTRVKILSATTPANEQLKATVTDRLHSDLRVNLLRITKQITKAGSPAILVYTLQRQHMSNTSIEHGSGVQRLVCVQRNGEHWHPASYSLLGAQ